LFIIGLAALMKITSTMEKPWSKRLHQNYMSRIFGKGGVSYVSPYSKLSEKELKEFEWRAHDFLSTTEIEFRQFDNEDPAVFRRMQLLIGSIAAQMTFKLPDDCFSIYTKILIYPDYYFNNLSKQYHKGETNPAAGLMVFSVRGITEGFALPVDGVNLLYHEMAHALYLEHKGMDYDLFDENHFSSFEHYAKAELSKEHGEDYFLRPYALTNTAEFFAVATENFFERPDKFSRAMPDLYRIFRDLYQQDPLVLK
jgi:MtfA peptidase